MKELNLILVAMFSSIFVNTQKTLIIFCFMSYIAGQLQAQDNVKNIKGFSKSYGHNGMCTDSPLSFNKNGDGFLGNIYNNSQIGLSFAQASSKITTRTLWSPGPGLPVTLFIADIPNTAQIEQAYLWWSISDTTGNDTNGTAFVTNPLLDTSAYNATLIGSGPGKCWGDSATRNFRADVTPSISGNGNYQIDISHGEWATDGVTLFIIYIDTTSTQMGGVIINDGSIVVTSPNTSANQTLTGINVIETFSNAFAFIIVSDMQENIGGLYSASVNNDTSAFSRNFWNFETISTLITPVDTSAKFTIFDNGVDCYDWVVMGLSLLPTQFPPCSLTNNQEICIVTVDSITGKNRMVWEKNIGSTCTGSYNIYKETIVADVYSLIGNVPYDSLGTFLDTNSNPVQKAARYKISAIDTNGVEYAKSTAHKTIHLSINLGMPPAINLIWSPYEGNFSFGTYTILRGNANGMDSITSVQSSFTSYTDPAPPAGDSLYQIEVVHPTGCNPTAKTLTYNSAKSNVSNRNQPTGITKGGASLRSVQVYPNPNKGELLLTMNVINKQDIEIALLNITGQVLLKESISQFHGTLQKHINLKLFPKGVYMLRIVTENEVMNKRVVIQ